MKDVDRMDMSTGTCAGEVYWTGEVQLKAVKYEVVKAATHEVTVESLCLLYKFAGVLTSAHCRH